LVNPDREAIFSPLRYAPVNFFSLTQRSKKVKKSFAPKLRIETLEDRTTPTVFTIESVAATGTTATASDNDFIRIDNALKGATAGDTIKLVGTFDFSETNAAASWALGSDGIAGNDDDYYITAPANLNSVTLTADNLGDATIQGSWRPGSRQLGRVSPV
jgi:hypothetical protein